MKRDKSETRQARNQGRREFMRTLAIGGGAATLVAATASFTAEASEPSDVAKTGEASDTTSKGYHVTAHIEEYYRKAAL